MRRRGLEDSIQLAFLLESKQFGRVFECLSDANSQHQTEAVQYHKGLV